MNKILKHVLIVLCILTCASTIAMAAELNVAVPQPIGVAADADRVLVTTPWCGAPKKIVNIKSGVAVDWLTLSTTDTSCQEIYIAISPGLGGFTAGDVFVTYNNEILKVSPPNTIVHFAAPGLVGGTHEGIRFDRVGTFGYNMLVNSAMSNSVFVIDHTGATVGSFTPAIPPTGGYELEQPNIAPLHFGPFGGYLWLMGEASAKMYTMSPIDGTVQPLPAVFPGGNSPESINFLGPQVCSVSVNGFPASYIDALYGSGLVRLYDVSNLPNKVLLNEEMSGDIHFVDRNGNFAGIFRAGLPQQELATIVSCPVTTGCTLTQGGYKNHFNDKLVNFPPGGLNLGMVFYTNAQLNQIMQNNAVRGNGLISLAHQLITAQLNIFYGAKPPQEVALAIVTANNLIGTAEAPPIGHGFLLPSATSGVATILDRFNEGLLGPPHCND